MKTILITGASSGIGLACAKLLAKKFKLILCSRNIIELEKIKENLGINVTVFQVDISKREEVTRLFNTIKSNNLSLDIVINSAGLALGLEKLEDGEISNWDQMIDTNIKGLLMVSKFALQIMKGQNSGEIINIGSIAGIGTYSKGVVYAASKAAVKSISDGLRKEVVENKIKITNIQPGLVNTNFSNVRFYGDKEKAQNVYKGIKPLSPEDIADVINYIVTLPEHVQINEITLTPVHQATVEIVHKKI